MPNGATTRYGSARALLYQQGQSIFAFVAISPPYSRPELEALYRRARTEPGNVKAQGLVNPFCNGPQIILVETDQSGISLEDFVGLVLRLIPNRALTSEMRVNHDDVAVMLAHLLRQHL